MKNSLSRERRHRVVKSGYGSDETEIDVSDCLSIRFYLGDNQNNWIDAEVIERDGIVGLSIRGASALVILPNVSNAFIVKRKD